MAATFAAAVRGAARSARSARAASFAAAQRAASTHSRGWYEKYRREGPEGFRVGTAPAPFDFDAAPAEVAAARSRCFFDVAVDGEAAGRIELELLDELLPETCENFRLLCGDGAPSGFGYAGANLARRVRLRGRRVFADEGFFVPHAEPGLLSMANAGVDTNGSQFYLTTAAAPHMDGRCVAFGRVAAGLDVVQTLADTLYTQRGVPVEHVEIAACGTL
ncbi:peptidyl-prolyl cis-trans isomerase [Aureococcus anophagefferens]|nr:peptidyl-prolyl cis-trans isomerase [Aureococcus anophagefferens]